MKLWDNKTPIAVVIAVVVIIIGFLTYQNSKNNSVSPTPAPLAATPTTNLIVATYEGKLPCADCEGIIETITLNVSKPDAADGTYLKKDTYQGKNTTPFEETGTWKVSQGMSNNPNAQVLELTPNDKNSQTNFYLVAGGGVLKPLTQDKEIIDSPFNQDLTTK